MRKNASSLIYKQVEDNLVKLIEDGKFQAGDKLPSDRVLAEKFSVNHRTVRRAMEEFVKAGVVERLIGAGTFLCAPFSDIKMVMDGKKKQPFMVTRTSVKKRLGLIVLNNRNPYSMELMDHFKKYARELQIDLKINVVSDFATEASSVVNDLTIQGCGAIMFLFTPHEGKSVIYDICANSKVPIVLSYCLPSLESLYFEKDIRYGQSDFVTIEMGIKYLTELGYGEIAYWGPDNPMDVGAARRLFSYIKNMAELKKDVHIGLSDLDFSQIDDVLSSWKPYIGDLAVLCYDDVWAQRLMTTAYRYGFSVPEGIAVIGINNTPGSKNSDPPLTSFAFDYDYVSHGMVNFAMNLADGKEERNNPQIKERLIVRNSCGGKLQGTQKLVGILEKVKVELQNDYREIEFSIE
jgi:GntR family transcriptional regulator, arabinose operon transcriptional repressor